MNPTILGFIGPGFLNQVPTLDVLIGNSCALVSPDIADFCCKIMARWGMLGVFRDASNH